MVFRPFKGEVLLGRISGATQDGITGACHNPLRDVFYLALFRLMNYYVAQSGQTSSMIYLSPLPSFPMRLLSKSSNSGPCSDVSNPDISHTLANRETPCGYGGKKTKSCTMTSTKWCVSRWYRRNGMTRRQRVPWESTMHPKGVSSRHTGSLRA